MIILNVWVGLLHLSLFFGTLQAISFNAEDAAENYKNEPVSGRIKRQLSSIDRPSLPPRPDTSNSFSGQELFRDFDSSIWGTPTSGGSGGGGGSGGSGSGSGYGWGTGYGSGSTGESGVGHVWNYGSGCSFPFVEVGNGCYYSSCSSNYVTWEAAMNFCKNYSSQLAVFTDTNQWVDALNYIRFKDPQKSCSYWIGGLNVNGVFQWTNGENMPFGTPFWGFDSATGDQNPLNVAFQNYAILSNKDFYRMDNIANSERDTYHTSPLCQYMPITEDHYGTSEEHDYGSAENIINAVVNQAKGSSFRSVQNVSFIETPTLNVTIQNDYNASSPINITVHPPKITYSYVDPFRKKHYDHHHEHPHHNYEHPHHNHEHPHHDHEHPHHYSSYGPDSFYHNPPYSDGGIWPVLTHGKTDDVITPEQLPETAIPDTDLLARILNAMKLLVDKIEKRSDIPKIQTSLKVHENTE